MAALISLPSIQEMFPDHFMDLGPQSQTMKLKSRHQRYSNERSAATKKADYSFDLLRSDPSSSSLEHIASSAQPIPRGATQASWWNFDNSESTVNGSIPAFRVVRPVYRRSNSSSSSVAVPRASRSRKPSSSSSNSSLDKAQSDRDVLSTPSTSPISASDQLLTEEDDSEERRHVCKLCNKRFNRPSSLHIHMNTHTGATPFRCPYPGCGREFNVNSNMRRHYRNHNNSTKSTDKKTNNNNANNNNNNNTTGHINTSNAMATLSTMTINTPISQSSVPPPTRFRYSPPSPSSPGQPTQHVPESVSPVRSLSHSWSSSISPLLGLTTLASLASVGSTTTTSAVMKSGIGLDIDLERGEREEREREQEGRVVEAKLEVTVEEDDDRTTTNNLKSESLTHLNVLSSSDSVRCIRINKRHPSNQPRSSVSWELDSKEGFLILRHDVPLHPILGSSLHYSFRSSGLNINSSSSEPGSSSSMFPVMSTAPGGRGGELGAVSSQTQSLARKRSDSVSVERGKRRKKLVTTGEEECH